MTALQLVERPKSLTSIVIERLRESIIEGLIEPGSMLSEKQIAVLFGTSKTPVREAFAHLQALGLLEILPQKGGIVFRPTLGQVRELCEVRLELELIALRLSVSRDLSGFIDHLSGIVQQMVEVYEANQVLAYQRLDHEYHHTFFVHCGNTLLAKAYDLFSPRICALRTHLSTPQPYLLSRSFEEHKQLLQLIGRRDVDSAILMLREHINRTRECHSKLLAETKQRLPQR